MFFVGGSCSKPYSTLSTEGAEAEFGATKMSAEGPGTPGLENTGGAGAPTRRRLEVFGRFSLLAEESTGREAPGQDAVDAKGGNSRVSEANYTFWGEVIESAAGGSTVSGLEAPVAAANCCAMSCSVGRTGVGGRSSYRLRILKESRTTSCDSPKRSSKLNSRCRVYRATAR